MPESEYEIRKQSPGELIAALKERVHEMQTAPRPVPTLEEAARVFSTAGAVILLPGARRSFSLQTVAARLEVSARWVRKHLAEFPGAFRLPGGELRIPESDVMAVESLKVAVPHTRARATGGCDGGGEDFQNGPMTRVDRVGCTGRGNAS